jgi:hypothetical protein
LDDDEDEALETRIEEEHRTFKMAQERKAEELTEARGWARPVMSSPNPGTQKRRKEELAAMAEAGEGGLWSRLRFRSLKDLEEAERGGSSNGRSRGRWAYV